MAASWRPYSSSFIGDATAFAFDPFQELFWTGSSFGRLSSYFIPPDQHLDPHSPPPLDVWSRYTAFRGHAVGPTKDLIVDERGVLSLGERSVKLAQRTGRCLWQALCVVDLAAQCILRRS